MDLTQLAQHLADIQVSSIAWFALALTLARLALLRVQSPGLKALAEVVEAALLAGVLVFLVIQPFLVKAFYIPSGSMIPTLIEDDHILVNKLEYRVENKHRGDVIVFSAPARALKLAEETQPQDYIKRLIGLPGDTIQVFHGYIQIGSRTYTHEDIANQLGVTDRDHQHVKIEAGDVRIYKDGAWRSYSPGDLAQSFTGMSGVVALHPGYVLRNGVKLSEPYTAEDPDYDLKIVDGHSVLTDPSVIGDPVRVDGLPAPPAQEAAFEKALPGPIPAGFVFAMGDNRNESSDSTRWGPLAENRIVGNAFVIFFPFTRIRLIH